MAKHSRVALFSLAILLCSGLAAAQTPDQDQTEEKVFNLVIGERPADAVVQEVEEAPRYEPAIEPGRWEVTLTLGYNHMNKTLLQFNNIIYKATPELFFYGDVELVSQAAFNPMLRIGYPLTTWLALETQVGVTFSTYEGSIENPFQVSPFMGTPEPVLELGPFDPERRSSLVFISNFNGVWYPFNMDGDGSGRVHPYLTGGLGYALYNLDSSYIDDAATSFNVNAGFGVRLITDKVIALRLEMLYQHHSIQFEPAEFFDIRDSGTVRIPVYQFDDFGNFQAVESYRENTLGGITWQVGFAVGF